MLPGYWPSACYYSIIYPISCTFQFVCIHTDFVAKLSKFSCLLLRRGETGTSPIVCTHRVHDTGKVRKLVHTRGAHKTNVDYLSVLWQGTVCNIRVHRMRYYAAFFLWEFGPPSTLIILSRWDCCVWSVDGKHLTRVSEWDLRFQIFPGRGVDGPRWI